ncbi:hypothetical protein KKB83_01155 [Patescibacteria group bacterium]|nr:hypothetical protein [Patescibacteria group bacterium]
MFQKDQFVIHPRYGAGKIVDLVTTQIRNTPKIFYIINPLLREIVIKIPTDSAEQVGLRSPMPASELDSFLSFLAEPFEEIQIFSRPAKLIKEIDLADPQYVLNVIKNLFYEKIERQREGRNLPLTKRRLYSTAISLLASEISVVSSCTLEEACFVVKKSLIFMPRKL